MPTFNITDDNLVKNQEKYLNTPNYTKTLFQTNEEKSQYDEGFIIPLKNDVYANLDEYRAQEQSTLDRWGNAAPRLVSKVATEVAKMPGYLGGGLGFLTSGDYTAKNFADYIDNGWIETLDNLNEKTKETFQVYTPSAVKNGSLWDNVSSASFWTNEGVDGAGFLLAALAPGAAIKGLGIGAKTARLFGSTTKLAENVDLGLATGINTFYEAGSEALGIKKDLDGQFKKLIDDQVINSKTGKPWTKEEADEAAGIAARDAFLTNMAVLLGPNLLMNKNILGKFNTTKSAISKITDAATGELVDAVTPLTKKQLIGNLAKEIGINIGAEGFWEEGVQNATQQYLTNVALNKTDRGFIDGIASEYIDSLSTLEGQKSIFLGGVFGSISGGIGEYRKSKQETKQLEGLRKLLSNNINTYSSNLTDLFKKDANGQIVLDENNKPVQDPEKVGKVIQSLIQGETRSKLKDMYAIMGDKEAFNLIRQDEFVDFAMPYLAQEGGIELLDKHIDSLSKKIQEELQVTNEAATVDDVKQDLKLKARELQKIHNKAALYGPNYSSLKYKSENEEKAQEFLSRLQFTIVNESARQKYYKDRTQQLKADKGLLDADNTLDVQSMEEIDKYIENYEKLLQESQENYKDLLDTNKQQKLFDSLLKESKEKEEENIKQNTKQSSDPVEVVSDFENDQDLTESEFSEYTDAELEEILNNPSVLPGEEELKELVRQELTNRKKQAVINVTTAEELDQVVEQLKNKKLEREREAEIELLKQRLARQKELENAFNNIPFISEISPFTKVKYKNKVGYIIQDEVEDILQFREEGTNNYTDIPKLENEETYSGKLYDYNIFELEKENPIVDEIEIKEVGNKLSITINGKTYYNNYSNPLMAINRDKEGYIISVDLETKDGKKRTFKKYADELAYNILLHTINKLENESNGTGEEFKSRVTEETSKQDFKTKESNITQADSEESRKIELAIENLEEGIKESQRIIREELEQIIEAENQKLEQLILEEQELIEKKKAKLEKQKTAEIINTELNQEPTILEDQSNQSQFSEDSTIADQDKVTSGNKINYATRDVVRSEQENKIVTTAVDAVNEGHHSENAKPDELAPGTKLTLKAGTKAVQTYNYQNGQAVLVNGLKEVVMLQPKDFTLENMPIEIYEGTKLVGYYPTVDWIKENHKSQKFNVAEGEYEAILQQVIDFRTSVWNNKQSEFETTVTDKKTGKLFLTKEYLPFIMQQANYVSDNYKNNIQSFHIADGNLFSDLDVINKPENEYNKGTVVQVIPMANGTKLAYPVLVPTLDEGYVDSMMSFIEAFYSGAIDPDQARQMIGIFNADVTINPKVFLEQFIFSQTENPTKANQYRIKLRGGERKLEITLMTADEKPISITNNIPGDKNSFNVNREALKNHLLNNLYSIKKAKLAKVTTKFNLVTFDNRGLVVTPFESYNHFVASIVKTSAKSYTLKDGSTIYAGQPVINFSTPKIKEVKPAVTQTTTTTPVSTGIKYSNLKVGQTLIVNTKEDPTITGILTVSAIENSNFVRFNINMFDGFKESNIGYSEKEFNEIFTVTQTIAATDAETGIKAKKADIERRREGEIGLGGFNGETEKQINAKYDAELAALEAKSTEEQPVEKPKVILPVKEDNQVKKRLQRNPAKKNTSSKSIIPEQRQALENSPSIEALTLRNVDGSIMDFTKQKRIVNLLVNYSSQYFVEGNTDVDQIFNAFFDDMEDLANEANNEENYTEELEFRNIVNQFEKISEFAKIELGKFGLSFKTKTVTAKEDNEDGFDVVKGERYEVDNVSKDPRNNVSWQVKLMLNNIYDFDNEETFMGYTETVPFEQVYTKLKHILKDINFKSFSHIIEYLQTNHKDDKIVEQVISKLKDSPVEYQNMFYTAMVSRGVAMQIINYVKEKGATALSKVSIFFSDRNSATQTLLNEWNNKAKIGSLVQEINGEKFLNKDKIKEFKEKADAIKDLGAKVTTDPVERANAIEFIKEFFTALNIDPTLADKIIDIEIQKRHFKKGLTKNGVRGLFDGKNGLIYNIINSLNNVVKDTKEEYNWELANPFIKEGSDRGISILAKIAISEGAQVAAATSAKNINKDTYWNFANNSHLDWTLNKLKEAVNLDNYRKIPALLNNYWLKPGFVQNISKSDLDGLNQSNTTKDGVQRPNMTLAEQLLVVVNGFTAKLGNNYNQMVFVSPTLSDKSNANALFLVDKLDAPAIILNGKEFTFSETALDELKNIAISEFTRIQAFKKAKNAFIKKSGKSFNEAEEDFKALVGDRHYDGASKFLLFPQFEELLKGVEEEKHGTIFNDNLNTVVNTVFTTMIKDFQKMLIDSNLITTQFAYINKGYIDHIKSNFKFANNDEIALYIAGDIVTNYALNYSGYMGLIGGDISQFYKKGTLGTYIEYIKRGAKDVAPGTDGSWIYTLPDGSTLDNSTQLKVYAKDFKVPPFGEYLQKQFGVDSFEITDAQEYTTLLEHINRMFAFEDLSYNDYVTLRNKIVSGETITKDDLNIVLQPFKLVYVNGHLENVEGYEFIKMTYDKTSSFPLIAELTKDTELDKVRIALEEADRLNGHKGVSLVYASGSKAGTVNPVTIWNNDGTVKNNLTEQVVNKVNHQSREGLRKQQHNPLKKSTEIKVVSQMDKLIHDGTLNMNFVLNGVNKTGKELRELKEGIRIEQYQKAATNLLKELGATEKDGIFRFEDLNKLIEVLKKEDREGKFSINDYAALTLEDGALKYPLSLLNKASEFELFLNSIITNRIINTKITGTSKIQGTSAGLKFLEDVEDRSGIIYTGTYDADGNFIRKYNGDKLNHLHKNEAGEVKVAQVFVPWKFKGLNMEDYLTPDGKHIDPDKLPEKLLQLIGARIPNQGHNSQLPIEIAGFLPEKFGDLMLVPYEIAKQMGSDFDVDKLYAYLNKHFVNEGIVEILTPNPNTPLENMSNEELEQLYKDIHWSILTDPQMTDKIVSSLDKDDLKIEITKAPSEKELILESPLYIGKHLLEYESQKDAKELVGLFSLGVTHNVITQGHNLFLLEEVEVEGKKRRIRKSINWFQGYNLSNLSGYGISTYNGEERTTTENLKIGQNAVLDNAKEKIAGILNLNKITYGVWNLLSRLSENTNNVAIDKQRALSLDYVARFINQPIINEYVQLVKNKQSSLNPNFTKTPQKDAIYELTTKYSEGLSDQELTVIEKTKFNLDNLQANLKKSNSKDHILFQLAVLKAYEELDAHAEDWNKIQTVITSDVNGATEDIITASAQIDKINRLQYSNSIANGVSLLGSFTEDGDLLPETQFGWAAKLGPILSAKLWAKFYPYNRSEYKNLEKRIEEITNKEDVISTEFRKIVWNNFKSFLFSSNNLGLFKDVNQERKRLLIDNYTVQEGVKIYENKSLATRALELKERINNLILQSLSSELATKNDDFSLVKFNVGGAKVDGDEYTKAFYDLLLSNDEEISTFAQDLITYQYITAGTQNAINIIKYIPIEYLNTIPEFSRHINYVFNNLAQPNFIRQFIQSNSRYAYQLKGELKTVLTPIDVLAKDKYPALLNITDNSGELNLGDKYIPYFAIYDSELKKSFLYEYVAGQYKLIPTLGTNKIGASEYQFENENAISLINKVKESNLTEPVIQQPNELEKTVETPVVTKTIEEEFFNQLELKNGGKKELINVLNNIANSTSKYAPMAEAFLEVSDLIPDNLRVEINNEDNRGSWDRDNNLMTFSLKGLKLTSERVNRKTELKHVEETVIHEVNHLINLSYLQVYVERDKYPTKFNKYLKGNTELLQSIIKLNNLLESTREYFLYNPVKPDSSNNNWVQQVVRYTLSNLYEFSSGVYDDDIQREFSKIKFSKEGKTLIEKLRHLLKEFTSRIMKSLGIEIKDSLLEDIIEANFKMAEEIQKIKSKEKLNAENNNLIESSKTTAEEVKPVTEKETQTGPSSFSYNGHTIPTEFQLGEDQKNALINLIDFVKNGNTDHKIKDVITLQGAAGTGKTTIIGYLFKYLQAAKIPYSEVYMAPTHAATAELAFATVKTGNTRLPSTLQSAITINPKTKKVVFTKKIRDIIGYSPIIILDESSMIDANDVQQITEAVENEGGKLIFLGDEKQISKVNNADIKQVSPAFTKFKQINLKKIFRQSENNLLFLLNKLREQKDFKLFKVPNSPAVQFVTRKEYNEQLINDLKTNPENTTIITYTNDAVKKLNNSSRQVLGFSGRPKVGEIVVGYLGYATKQIEKQNIANSIPYTITNVEKNGSIYVITGKSQKLEGLIKSGITGITSNGRANYYQLSAQDSLLFDDLTQKDFEENNKKVSSKFRKIHNLNLDYASKKIDYRWYQAQISALSMELGDYSVGNKYIFNPATDQMELFDANRHKGIKQSGQGSLVFEKDIDYGYAITIHKSQGTTIGNVYFDLASVNVASNTKIVDENGNQITTEKQSLAYVGMSRSKNKLVISENELDLPLISGQQVDKNDDLSGDVIDTLSIIPDKKPQPVLVKTDLVSRFKKEVGLNKKTVSNQQQININLKVKKFNGLNGTSFYVKFTPFAQTTDYTWEIQNKAVVKDDNQLDMFASKSIIPIKQSIASKDFLLSLQPKIEEIKKYC